jgi:hypothetical protein
VRVRDLSTGGVGLMLLPGKDAQPPPQLPLNTRLRIELIFGPFGEPLILEGRVCYIGDPNPAGSTNAPLPLRAGVQFKLLENDIEGRQILAALTRIVGKLQREEARRTRTESILVPPITAAIPAPR